MYYKLKERTLEELKEKTTLLTNICRDYQVPMFITFTVENTEDDTDYQVEVVRPDETRYFSLSKDVINDIETAMSLIMEYCQIYKISCFITVAVENTAKKTVYKRRVHHPTHLTNDQIAKHILVVNQFELSGSKEEAYSFFLTDDQMAKHITVSKNNCSVIEPRCTDDFDTDVFDDLDGELSDGT